MVYESGFTTRRTYSSRPVVTSYAVTYPSVSKVTRVYKSSYPIYSTSIIPRRYVGSRVISSPVRVVTSPTRVVVRSVHSPSPVRVVRTTTRVISSPERTTYSYTMPSAYYRPTYYPSTYYSSTYTPTTYSTYSTYTPSYYYSPTTVTRLYSRSVSPVRITSSPLRITPSYLKRIPPGYGARALTNYLNTEPFTTFSEETGRIRHRAQSLMRDLHTPVVRRARSCTPFPVTGYTYEPTSQLALDAYVARVTNPVRHIAKEAHIISHYPRPAVKYVGKSHLASVRICGDKAYNIRKPMYDSDKVRTDINLLSWYLRHPTWKNEKQGNDSNPQDAELDPNRPSRKFSAPRPLEDAIDVETKEKKRLRQEQLMTVTEEVVDDVELRARNAQIREEKALEEEKNRKARQAEAAALEEEKKRFAAEKAAKEAEKEKKRLAAEAEAQRVEEERLAAEAAAAEAAAAEAAAAEAAAAQAAAAEAAALEEKKRLEAEEEAKRVEEERLAAEAAAAEAAALEEKKRLEAEAEAKRIEEERLAAEAEQAAIQKAKELEEEQRLREEELNRLAEIEKQAEEEREADLARQAAELAEIARQESEIAAQELEAIQKGGSSIDDPIIDEPETPVDDSVLEPSINLNIDIKEADNIITDSYDEEAEEEEIE